MPGRPPLQRSPERREHRGRRGAAADTLKQWKNSPPHRANLLRTKFKVMGIARAHDGDSMLGWFWTADFGATVGKTMSV